jgi:small subunit ribosomal protein S20
MPNIKSAKKRVLITEKKTNRNRIIKSQIKTCIKKFDAAVSAKNADEANALLPLVFSEIDQACAKGIIHKNNADRKKARLSAKLNKIAAN